jgi:hypothetical protein
VPPPHAHSDAAPAGQYSEEDWSQQARGRPPGPPPHLQVGPPNGYSNGPGGGVGYGGAVGGYPPANGYGQNYAQPAGYYPPNQQQQMSGGGPPQPPRKEMQVPRKVISLNNPNPEAVSQAPQRKSWLKRFSRSGK